MLIDADGLNTLATYGVEILNSAKCKVVLTPHIKEFSRLVDKEIGEIITDTVSLAINFAKEYGVVLVLKSATSVITDGTEFYLNTTGCNGLAKAGSGDILSGVICGLMVNNPPFESAIAGCYLFGLAGEIACKEQNEYTMTATDVINCLPKAINRICK